MMLENMRESLEKSKLVRVILFVIIVFFVFAGYFTATLFSDDAGKVAEVDGIEITKADIEQAIERKRQQTQNFDLQYQTDASKELLREQTRQELINQRIYSNSISKAGLTASKEQVIEELRKIPAFQKDGLYSPESAKDYLANQRMSQRELEQIILERITEQQFNNALVETSFTLDREIANFYKMQKQTRDARVLKVPQAQFSKGITVSAEEIDAFYTANQASYQEPEKVSLQYLLLTKDNLAKIATAKISDEQVKAYYEKDDNKNQFVTPGTIKVAHILISNDTPEAETKAADLWSQLQGGADFSELAKEHSADTFSGQNGGELNEVTALEGSSGWVPEFEKAALALTEKGSLTQPVKSSFGYHIIKLLDRAGGKVKSLDEATESIKQVLSKEQADKDFFAKKAVLADALFSTDSIEDLAKTAEVPLEETALFDSSSAPIALNDLALLEKVFSESARSSKDISDEVTLADGSVVYFVVKDYQPAGVKPLNDVEPLIKTQLTAQKAGEQTKVFAEQLASDLKEGKDVSALLAEKELSWVENKAFSFRDATLEPMLVSGLFQLAAPTTDKAVIKAEPLSNGDYAVFDLKAVNYPELETLDSATKEQIKAQLVYLSSQSDFTNFVKALRAKANIK